jgi:hypothetical protein
MTVSWKATELKVKKIKDHLPEQSVETHIQFYLIDIFSMLNTSDVDLFDPLGSAGKFEFYLSSNISS